MMAPRPYQSECVEAVRAKLAEFPSTLVEAATGTGKTVIFSHLAKDWPGRVMVVAHREELIHQAADKIRAVTGDTPAIEMAANESDERCMFGKAKVVVATVQTLGNRLGKFDPREFGLVIIDEAHHAVANSYRKVVLHFQQNPACKLLGVTATPKRADELALGQIFCSVAYQYPIVRAVDDGYLVPVCQQMVEVEGLDFSQVSSVAGDFNEGELEKILAEESMLHKVASPVAELVGQRPTLVFCCTVKHAELIAAVLNRYRPGQADHLSGATDRGKRAEVVAKFKEGGLQFLCNCALFLEGFDAPRTAAVVMARPTKSPVLYAQVLGRGTRPLPGVVDAHPTPEARRAAVAASAKPDMLALDFVGNAGRHKIVTALDILGGKYGAPVQQYARETLAEESRPAQIGDALERAQAELDLLEEEKERRRKIKAQAEYKARQVSPFDTRQSASRGMGHSGPEMASAKQVRYLIRLGVSAATARAYTKRQASAVIDDLLSKQGGER